MTWLLEDFSNWLLGVFIALIMAILYPLVVAVDCLQTLFNGFYVPIVTLINAFLGIYNLLLTIISQIYGTVFPQGWTAILLVALAIRLGLVFYRYLRDIEIVGCKV